MNALFKWTVVAVVALALIWALTDFGLWYSGIIVGFLVGIFLQRGWRTLTVVWVACLGAWGLQLLWQARTAPMGEAASVVTGMMGFGTQGVITIVLTLSVAFLLATAGAWLGLATIGLFPLERH